MNLAKPLRRWLYRGRRAHRLARLANRVQARLAAIGLGPARVVVLQVPGWKTGKVASFPLVVADYDGGYYLVSMLGEGAVWVRNVRSAGGRAVLRHGTPRAVHLTEVETAARGPILRRYLDCAPGARPHIAVNPQDPPAKFDEIAPRYPVFRVEYIAP